MAHFLDRIFFTALTVAVAFCAALSITDSLPAAMLAGFLAPFPLRFLFRLLRRHLSGCRLCMLRKRRRRAAQTVRYWSVLRDENCRNDILTLLKAAYPASAPRLCLSGDAAADAIPAHIMLTLRPVSEDAMADALRRIRQSGTQRAVIACTQTFSPEARALTLLPEHSRIALIDGDMLASLLAKHPDAVPMQALPRLHPPRPALNRSHALRMLPAAALLAGIYLVFDLPLYLPAAMAVLWGALLLMRRRPASAALFP